MICGCYVLHYGREWLFHSMRSVRPYVDEIFVFYTPKPSFGHSTSLPCPETREELMEISKQFGVKWFEGEYVREQQHRDSAVVVCDRAGADTILVVDADEVWDPDHLKGVLNYVDGSKVKEWRVNMRHFWRSLNWICDDPCMPVRVIVPGGAGEGYLPVELGKVWHMGYAQSSRIIRYKMAIHGHANVIPPGWFKNVFLKWKPGVNDVHPTNEDFWHPKLFDKQEVESLVGDHPYYRLNGVIENPASFATTGYIWDND